MAKKQEALTPRKSYPFTQMNKGETVKIALAEDDPKAGAKALCAAYQIARRYNWRFRGQTKVIRGRAYMLIERYV